VKAEPRHDPFSNHILLEDCEICGLAIKRLEEIKKVVGADCLEKVRTVEKLIRINN
jgi:hypothetical protein